MKKRKLTILFYGNHLSYSPTVIGLYDLLIEHFDVTIIAKTPPESETNCLSDRKVIYLKNVISSPRKIEFYARFFQVQSFFDENIALLRKNAVGPQALHDFYFIRRFLQNEKPDLIIAVDFYNLWFTELLKKEVHFLSLEIVPHDVFYENCTFSNIKSVVIQSRERYQHLFGERNFPTFFVQNAPIFKPFANDQPRKDLIYAGTAADGFGFYQCLEFLQKYPNYSLSVRGRILAEERHRIESEHQNLIVENRLKIDETYLDDPDVVDFLKQFRIGFCFYNFDFAIFNNFNYFSAPSGKMFKYFAAGVPVIGIDILGLQPIREFDCGILIKDLQPASIEKAIKKIEADFAYYSENCLKAAKHYSFDKSVKPFVEYLLAS